MGYYVVGNNISITRGDSAVIALEITDKDGAPYIIADGDQLTMTVKASIDDVVPVIVKTLDHGRWVHRYGDTAKPAYNHRRGDDS